MINYHAKIFTRTLNARLSAVANKTMQPSQAGFMRWRFIDGNGLALELLVDQAKVLKHPEAGLLLDQEMAYGRINPKYLAHVQDQVLHL